MANAGCILLGHPVPRISSRREGWSGNMLVHLKGTIDIDAAIDGRPTELNLPTWLGWPVVAPGATRGA